MTDKIEWTPGEGRGLREFVKSGDMSAQDALDSLREVDPNPPKSIVRWLKNRGAK